MMSVPAKSDLRLAPLKQHFDSYIKTSERRGGKREEEKMLLYYCPGVPVLFLFALWLLSLSSKQHDPPLFLSSSVLEIDMRRISRSDSITAVVRVVASTRAV